MDKVQAAVKAFMEGNTQAVAKAIDALSPLEAKECVRQFAVHLTETNKMVTGLIEEHDQGCHMLAKYAQVAHEFGIRSFHFGDLGVELQPLQPAPKPRRKAPRKPKRRR